MAEKGRGLETVQPLRDGEVVCETAALFFDEWDALKSTLDLNPHFKDRVVRINDVKRSGKSITIWAIMVGLGQYAQHFAGYRGRHNAELQFCPVSGFNDGALRIVVSTRTGVGISPGAPILLNYGLGFDFGQARVVASCQAAFGVAAAGTRVFNFQLWDLPSWRPDIPACEIVYLRIPYPGRGKHWNHVVTSVPMSAIPCCSSSGSIASPLCKSRSPHNSLRAKPGPAQKEALHWK